jgi:NADP-dependent 3-hydroxy acid dehydrogenase YdfG
MEFGLRGRTAIVCAASMGLGKSCALALGGEGVKLVIVARRPNVLQRAADEIEAATGTKPIAVAADVTTLDGRGAILAACPDPDILINNAGGPPAGDFRNWAREDWIKALDANMLAPIELMKATIDGMIARKFGRIVNITSHAVKAPVSMLGLSNGARSGLTGFVAGLCSRHRRAQRHHQQSAAGHVRYRRVEIQPAGACDQHQTLGRGSNRGHPEQQSVAAIWAPGRIWRDLRVPLLDSGGLHHRAEHSRRWRGLSRHVLSEFVFRFTRGMRPRKA